MTYITREDRKELDALVDALSEQLHKNNTAGEYNYVISRLLHKYIQNNGLRYQHLNTVIGFMEAAKAEFIRTVVSPYENIKAQCNGAVSKLDSESMSWPWYCRSLEELKKQEQGEE